MLTALKGASLTDRGFVPTTADALSRAREELREELRETSGTFLYSLVSGTFKQFCGMGAL